MRKIIIRFNDDGSFFRELNEERNYFFSEAEEIVEKIRRRLQQEKRMSDPKTYECWLDGQRAVVTYVSFEEKGSLEEQLVQTMLEHDGWDEEIRHKYVNKLKEYTEKERQLFLNSEFKAFAVRFDQVLGNKEVDPFPFLLDIEKLKELFDEVYVHIATGFYSELEEIMSSILLAFQTVVRLAREELFQLEKDEKTERENMDSVDFLKVRVATWLGHEENFQKFKNYVASCYQSVSKTRIDSLFPRYKPYQEFQTELFKKYVAIGGFDAVYQIHDELIETFYEKYNNILFEGFVLKTDEMVESLVLNPVIQEIREKVKEKFKEKKRMRDNEESNEEVAVQ